MSFRILLVLVLGIFSSITHAQRMEKVTEHIDTLCSSYMYGRGYVREGANKAATYIANEFEKYGLKKFNKQQQPYLQPFRFNINTFPGRAELRMGDKVMELGKDFILAPFSSKGKGNKKVVIVDSGSFNNALWRTKFMSQRLKGKVVIYHEKDHNAIMGLEDQSLEVITHLYSAKALIMIKENKLTASLSASQYAPPVYEVLKGSLPDELKKVKFRLDAEEILDTSYNVMGYVKGSEYPDSFVVYTAHYDHLGGMGDVFFPGANDNAAGVSMLLELAHFYSRPENKPKHSVVFMAFSGEEAGLIGSKYYTAHPYFKLNRIKFLLNMDLVGTGSKGATVVNGTRFKGAFSKLVKLNEKGEYLPKIKIRGEAANSDHYFFTQAGVPSFFIYLMGGPSAYHDVYDVPDGLPLTKFRELFELLIEFERSL